MATVGTLSVDLIAQTASFNSNIEKAARNLNTQTAQMNRSIDSLNRKVDSARATAKSFADVFLTYEVGKQIGQALNYAASLGEVSQQLGVTTKDLQVYRYIGTQVGITQEEMEKGLAKLTISLGQAALGAAGQGKAFAALGISVRDANGHVKTAGDVMPEIADKLARIQDPAQRAAIEIALFGRAGQKLDTILTEGRKGIEDYAKEAQDAGMIIGDDLAKQADDAADKIEALTTQLKVNFSREVAENAGAILGLVTALEKATGAALTFIGNYPRLSAALAGAAVGARLAGAPGAIVGAGAGALAGDRLSRSAADGNTDLQFRAKRLQAARDELRARQAADKNPFRIFGFRHSEADGGTVKSAQDEVNRQAQLWNQAVRSTRKPAAAVNPNAVDLPDFLGSGGGAAGGGHRARRSSGASSAERARDEAIRRDKAFQDELARMNDDLLDARRDNVTDEGQLAQIARDQVGVAAEKLRADIEAKAKLGDYTRVQADQLEALADQTRAQKLMAIDMREAQRQADAALQIQSAANDNQRDILQIGETLATNAGDRRDIQLRLLELDKQEEQAKLAAVIASRDTSEAERKIAQARLAQLDTIYGGRAAVVRDQTAGPLESYAKGLRMSPQDINERVQQYTVDELNAVHDGITSAITNAIGVNDPMISGIISLLVDQLLIRPITEALMKAQSAGGGGGGLGGLIGGIGSLFGGGGLSASGLTSMVASNEAGLSSMAAGLAHFANGTAGARGGLSLVGENGPELLRLPTGAQVTPSPRTASLLRQGFTPRNDNSPAPITVHVNAAMSGREARETGDQIGRAIRRQMNGPVRSAR